MIILAGLKAPIFLITANFKTIKTYNNSTSYALAVSLLGDAILDGQGCTPPGRLTTASSAEPRSRNCRRGSKKWAIMTTTSTATSAKMFAPRFARYQEKIGETPDGYATPAVLKRVVEAP